MRRPISTTLIGILCVGACQRRTQSPDSAVAGGHGAPEAAAVPPRLWVFSGGETGPLCLFLRGDSSGGFFSGFEGNNPLHWRYDRSAHRPDLTLSHLPADGYSVLTGKPP